MTIQEQFDKAHHEDVITVAQFALLAQYDPQTVYRKIKADEIPGVVRYGRSVRIVKRVALAWTQRFRQPRD